MKKTCAICGGSFEAAAHNAKYCSRCRSKAEKLTRAKWEERTGYKEKRSIQRKQKRKKNKAEDKVRQEEERQELINSRNVKAESLKEERKAELTERAKKGDISAKMHLALMDGDMLNYWKYRAELIWAEDEKFGHTSNNTVGGISVSDPNFAELVMYDTLNGNEVKNYG